MDSMKKIGPLTAEQVEELVAFYKSKEDAADKRAMTATTTETGTYWASAAKFLFLAREKITEMAETDTTSAPSPISDATLNAANAFLAATSKMPPLKAWADAEGFYVIKWGYGPGRMFTLKVDSEGVCHWAAVAQGQRRGGKYAGEIPREVMAAVELVVYWEER